MQLTKTHGGNILKVHHKQWPVNKGQHSQVTSQSGRILLFKCKLHSIFNILYILFPV